MEYVDVYNEKKEKTNKIIKRDDIDSLNGNDFIIIVHCWIINSEKEILLTQRSMNVNRGGMWEDTHGGLRAGETSLDGIKRELKEELGIATNDNELILVKTLKKDNVFRDIYIMKKDISLETIDFYDGEVMNAKYVSIEEFKTIIEKGESSVRNFKDTIFYNSNVLDF
ncbi:MAG: NUDIX domain-containing protein [Clostridia bacterium]|nr:NUDIX domain-containing protein [Clostridia bacterium]